MLNIKGVEPRKALKDILSQIKKEGQFAPAPPKKDSKALFVVARFDEDLVPLFQLVKSSEFNQKNDKDQLYRLSDNGRLTKDVKVGDQFFGEILPDKTVKLIREVRETPQDLVYGYVSRLRGQLIFESSDRQDRGTYRILNGKVNPETYLNHFVKARFVPGRVPTVDVVEDIGGFAQLFDFVIERHELPHVFSKESLASLKGCSVPDLEGREDLRQLPFVTIDGKDAKDFDDAVFAEPLKGGLWRLMVAIADVTYYVKEGSSLDLEALDRGNSVYFPGRVIPMLPEKLSNDLCSLRSCEDRAVMAVEIILDADGYKKEHRFFRGLIHSHARLTYQQVEEKINAPKKVNIPEVDDAVQNLIAAYAVLKKARVRRDPLEITSAELMFHFDESGTISSIANSQQLESHQLIEEMMVLANQCAAETLSKARIKVPFRIHESPAQEKVSELKFFLKSLGLKSNQLYTEPKDFNALMRRLDGNPLSGIVMEMVLRTQSKAIYSPDNIGHFGLNLTDYCHFTSPIRRYADVLVHRALAALLEKKTEAVKARFNIHMKDWCEQISEKERRATYSEREVYDRLTAFYFSDKIGENLKGFISGISRAGLFITLSDFNVSGLVPMSSLTDDFYMLKQNPDHLKGRRRGRMYRLGDFVAVELQEVDLAKGRLNFRLEASPKKDRNKKRK